MPVRPNSTELGPPREARARTPKGLGVAPASHPIALRRTAKAKFATGPSVVIDGHAAQDQAEDAVKSIGRRVKGLRTGHGYSLRDLAARAQLSAGFLSLVERGQASLGLNSLLAVAHALGVSPAELLEDVQEQTPRPRVLAACITNADHPHYGALSSKARAYRLLSAGLPQAILEPTIVSFPPMRVTDVLAAHAGEEFGYVLKGELLYKVGQQRIRLVMGDSIHILSTTPHAVCNYTSRQADMLWVQTPPVLSALLPPSSDGNE
jgi:transcriptional regulator with XRE-family HTH domain